MPVCWILLDMGWLGLMSVSIAQFLKTPTLALMDHDVSQMTHDVKCTWYRIICNAEHVQFTRLLKINKSCFKFY